MRINPVLAAGAAAATLSIGALAPTALAAATETTTQADFPLAGLTFPNPCAPNDIVTLTSGDFHLAMHIGDPAAGGEVISGVGNLQDVAGVDTQGIKYREIGTGTEGQVMLSNGGEAATTTTSLLLVSQTASDPNVHEYLIFHVTLNPEGYTLSSVETGNATCQT